MSRGLSSLLESAAPTLFIALVVLIGGVGYGLYERQKAPAPEAAAATEQTQQ